MKCKNVRKMIWLYPSELATDDQLNLESHVESCVSCRRVLAERMAQISVVASLKKTPALEQPEEFMISVLRRVRRLSVAPAENLIDRLLDFFARRSVRIAFAAWLLVTMTFFAAHEIVLLRRIQRLEQQVALHKNRDLPPNWEKVSAELLSRLEADQLPKINEVSRQELLDVIELLQKNPLLFKAVEQQTRMYLRDGLNPDELSRLLTLKAVQEKLKSL